MLLNHAPWEEKGKKPCSNFTSQSISIGSQDPPVYGSVLHESHQNEIELRFFPTFVFHYYMTGYLLTLYFDKFKVISLFYTKFVGIAPVLGPPDIDRKCIV